MLRAAGELGRGGSVCNAQPVLRRGVVRGGDAGGTSAAHQETSWRSRETVGAVQRRGQPPGPCGRGRTSSTSVIA